TAAPEPLLLPLPLEPCDDVPAERDVPLSDVFAFDEMLPVVLALDNTVVLAPAVEERDSAELEFTLEADVVLLLAAASAEVDDAAEEARPAEDGVNSALPGDTVAPAPAPEDDPAVLDVAVVEELPFSEDWM